MLLLGVKLGGGGGGGGKVKSYLTFTNIETLLRGQVFKQLEFLNSIEKFH